MDQTAMHTQQPIYYQQSGGRLQGPAPDISPGQRESSMEVPPVQQQISGSREQGPIGTSSAQELSVPDDVWQVSTQERGQSIAGKQKEEHQMEVQASVPEVTIEQSVEHVVERSAEVEKPEITEELQTIGITHSGPGIPIEVDDNTFSVHTMPMKYEEAVAMDKKSSIKEGKHWLAELIMYVWRKIDPTTGQKTQKGGANE